MFFRYSKTDRRLFFFSTWRARILIQPNDILKESFRTHKTSISGEKKKK